MSGPIDFSPAGYPRQDKYRKDYLEALDFWETGRHDECVDAARYNLTDPTLPRYFRIKNRILIVSAEHDWAIAEKERLESERIFAEAVSLTKRREVTELHVLELLRADLDELKQAHGDDPRLYEQQAGQVAGVMEVQGEQLAEEVTPDLGNESIARHDVVENDAPEKVVENIVGTD